MKAATLLREPLLHFFVLGLLLFLLYGLVADQATFSADEIIVDQARITGLAANFEQTWRRKPTDNELQGLIDAWVREEILYREGIAIGFDQNDPVIRRRVAQKMSFIADGLVPDTPTDAELEAWLQDNIADYQVPATFTLRQVYIDPQRHPGNLDAFLASTLAALQGGDEPDSLGDSSMLLSEVEGASSQDIARIFGTVFVEGLATAEAGTWSGPIQSGYGLHFVYISAHTPARDPQLADVRAAVERDLLNDRAEQINESFYASLRERYTVRIGPTDPND
jgi:hypothetical protein